MVSPLAVLYSWALAKSKDSCDSLGKVTSDFNELLFGSCKILLFSEEKSPELPVADLI